MKQNNRSVSIAFCHGNWFHYFHFFPSFSYFACLFQFINGITYTSVLKVNSLVENIFAILASNFSALSQLSFIQFQPFFFLSFWCFSASKNNNSTKLFQDTKFKLISHFALNQKVQINLSRKIQLALCSSHARCMCMWKR